MNIFSHRICFIIIFHCPDIYTSPSKLLASVEVLATRRSFEGAADHLRKIVEMPKMVAEAMERGRWEEIKNRFLL